MRMVCLFVLIASGIYADDVAVTVAGGAVGSTIAVPDTDITMVSEHISILLSEKTYSVNVKFDFFNTGSTKRIQVGFPQWRLGTTTEGAISNFHCKINNVESEFQELPSTFKFHEGFSIDKWFVREITFEGSETTTTEISYSVPYANGWGSDVNYLYGTGGNWKGSIGAITVEIRNPAELWVYEVAMDDKKIKGLSNADGVTEFSMTNVNPSAGALLSFGATIDPYWWSAPKMPNPERNWIYSRHTFDLSELALMTKTQLRLVRNIIFAAHGNIFDSADINDWLKRWAGDWYRPMKRVTIDELNQIERKNVEMILAEEGKRRG